jgi:hypothetical protein
VNPILERLKDDAEPPLTTPDEAGLWAFLRELAWPDPSPEIDGLMERVDAGAALLWRDREQEQVIAIWDAYRVLTQRFRAARLAWSAEGKAITVPPGIYAQQIGTYAIVRGEETFARVLASAAAASALASEPGFLAHCAALAGLDDLFRRALDDVDEQALERLLGDDAKAEREAREAAWRSFAERSGALDEAQFWEVVAALDWADEENEAMTGVVLASLGATGVVAFSSRRLALAARLEERLLSWETETGEPIEAGDDSFRDLINHLIGLGREAYERALADPASVAARARAHDYRESFAYVEQWAWEEIPLEAMQEASAVS